MHKFGLAGTIALLASLSLANEVQFSHDIKGAFAQAKSSHKLLMVDFYTDWCGWCKRLDAGAYKDPGVAETSRKFVPLKTDAEKDGKDLAAKYNIHGYPTILFIDASGNQVAKLVGYQPAPDFAETLKSVLSLKSDWPSLLKRVHSNPKDGEAAAELSALYGLTDQPSLVDGKPAVAGWVHTMEAANYGGKWSAKAYMALGDQLTEAKLLDDAKAAYVKAEAVATDPADKSNALMDQFYMFQAQKDPKSALAVLDRLDAMKDATAEWVQITSKSRAKLEAALNTPKG